MKPIRQPWYIKLARKLGAKTDHQAVQVCFYTSIVLILISIVLYREFLFNNQTPEPIDAELLRSMERSR